MTPTDNAHIIFESTPTQTFRIQPSSLKYAEHEKTEESEKIYMPAINSDCIPDEEVSRKGDNATTNDEKETTGKKSSDSTLKINISLDVISKKQAVMQEIIQKAPAPKVGGVTGFRHLIPETITDSLIASPTTREKLIIESILELDPSDLGQQLTIIEQKLFRNIQLHEFYCQAWTDKSTTSKSPNIVRVVNWFNHIALGVASQVINHENIKNRVSVLKKFIITAHNCLGWCNFNTCFEIVAGLNLGPVSRLKQTWKLLPKKYHEVWKVLNQFVSNEG